MDNHVTYRQAIKILDSQNMKYEILQLDNNWRLIITQYGGRAIGPFKDEDSESVLWLNEAFCDEASFEKFVKNREVHLGGERFWVNPELRFFCDTPEKFDDTYFVQPSIDPGNYNVNQTEMGVELDMDVILDNRNCPNSNQEKIFYVKRRYYPAVSPLKYVKELKDIKVDYCGFSQDIFMKDNNPKIESYLEPWILTQVNPNGKFITPYSGDFDYVDYYIPVDDMQKVHDGYAELEVTGNRKYKVAYRSAKTMGRMGFLKQYGDKWHLMIRNYYNDPSVPYCSEPWGDLENRGCSTYYYNDDETNGGFAEFENSGKTIGIDSGRLESHDTTSLWFFFGEKEEIIAIMRCLLGINYKF